MHACTCIRSEIGCSGDAHLHSRGTCLEMVHLMLRHEECTQSMALSLHAGPFGATLNVAHFYDIGLAVHVRHWKSSSEVLLCSHNKSHMRLFCMIRQIWRQTLSNGMKRSVFG